MHAVVQFFLFFPAQEEVAEAIGVGRGFAAVPRLGSLRAPVLQLGPFPLKSQGLAGLCSKRRHLGVLKG